MTFMQEHYLMLYLSLSHATLSSQRKSSIFWCTAAPDTENGENGLSKLQKQKMSIYFI